MTTVPHIGEMAEDKEQLAAQVTAALDEAGYPAATGVFKDILRTEVTARLGLSRMMKIAADHYRRNGGARPVSPEIKSKPKSEGALSMDEVVSALRNLGYRKRDAEAATNKVWFDGIDGDEAIRKALAELSTIITE